MYGERLKELRKARNLTIDDISHDLQIGRSTYAGYERKHRKPPIDTLKQIAEYHGVSTDYILGLTDEKDPQKVEYNVEEYLKKNNLNWGGKPLSEEDLKPIRDILEVIVRDRLPVKKTLENNHDITKPYNQPNEKEASNY